MPDYGDVVLIGVLGTPAVASAGGMVPVRGRRQAALLGLLAVQPGAPVGRGRLEEELWGDVLVSDAALRVVVNRLRKQFIDAGSPDPVRFKPGGYCIDCDPDDVDACRFAVLAAGVAGAEAVGDDARVLASSGYACALWYGEPLAGVDDVPSLQVEAARLRGLRADTQEARSAALLRLGDALGAGEVLRQLTADEPYRERGWAMLVVALSRGGRQREALDVYDRARRLLADGLGIAPSGGLKAVAEEVRSGGLVGEDLLRVRHGSVGTSSTRSASGDGGRVIERWQRRLAEPRICLLGTTGLFTGGAFVPVPDRSAGELLSTIALSGPSRPERWAAEVIERLGGFLQDIIDGPRLLIRRGSLVLDPADWPLDVHLVTALRAAATEVESDPGVASWLLSEALRLWHDGGGDGPGAHWNIKARLDVEDDHVAALLAAGSFALAEPRSRALVAEDPTRDRRWAQLIAALASLGRHGEALGVFREARAWLVEERGRPLGSFVGLAELAVLSVEPRPSLVATDSRRFPIPPAPLTPIVARTDDAERCHAVLAEGAPVVITGPPGVGKTRLAQDVATVAEARGATVGWIDLRSPPDPAAITAWLDGHHGGLVVVDNAEMDAVRAAEVVDELRTRPAAPDVIVASRLPVDLVDATHVALRPLTVPANDDPATVEASDAAVLLRHLCHEVTPHAELSTTDVASICHRTGGLPLALRLAAESTKRTSPAELASAPIVPDAISDGLTAVLATIGRFVERAFPVLGLLPGPFDAELAAATLGTAPGEATDVLSALVDRALLELHVLDGDGTYQMLQPLRDVAVRTLSPEERTAALDGVVHHCLHQAHRRLNLSASAEDRGPAFLRTRRELAIFHLAMGHLADNGDAAAALKLGVTLDPLLYASGRWNDKNTLLDRALAIPGPPSRDRAGAHVARGCAGLLHQTDIEHLTVARTMAAAIGAREIEGKALTYLGIAHWWSGSLEESASAYASALDVAGGIAAVRTEAQKFAAITKVAAGDSAAGLAELAAVVAELDQIPSLWILAAHARMYLGHCRRHTGDLDAAINNLSAAADVWGQVDNTASAIHTHAGLAELHADRDDTDRALRHGARALDLARLGNIDVYTPWVLCTIARAHLGNGDHARTSAAAAAAVRAATRTWSGERHRVAAELAWIALHLDHTSAAARILGVANTHPDQRELPFCGPNEASRLDECHQAVDPAPDTTLTLEEAATFT